MKKVERLIEVLRCLEKKIEEKMEKMDKKCVFCPTIVTCAHLTQALFVLSREEKE